MVLTTRRRPAPVIARQRWPWALSVALLLVATACTGDGEGDGAPMGRGPDAFVRAEGRGLVTRDGPVRLLAVNFSNLYHRNMEGAELLESPHHAEEDFARVKELGFNSIRFAFDGDWYMDAPDVFWEWLDENVGWARKHELRLILDLHTPIGGFWLDPTSDAVSFDIWSDPDIRQQNAAMWREIATRYEDEPAVAAYDLLNEPVTTDSTGQQWRELAQELVDAVRSVDQNHLLVVGGIYGVEGRYGMEGRNGHFLVDDDNVVYDFHFYEPIKYTHQYASWVEGPIQDGGRYPDPEVILPTGDRVWLPDAIATPTLPAGTSDWTLYDSGIVPIEDEAAVAAIPLVYAEGGMRGTAYFDVITVTEYAPDGTEIREIVDDGLDPDGTLDWYPWESGGEASTPAQLVRESSGHEDAASLSITDMQTDGAIAGWSNDGHLFTVVPGNQYRVRGYMRGQDVAPVDGQGPLIGLRLDVYGESPGAAGGGFLERDKSYLEHEMREHLQFGIENEVPMSVMEFGVVRQAFQMEGKGGDVWVTDMLALLEKLDLSFAYWEYNGAEMGIYLGPTGEPSEPNEALRGVLMRELG